ncbi:MAG: 30S ribosomal protein S18 [Patescibacteria group bacterium]|jgi:small subunit ribosomal protein S18
MRTKKECMFCKRKINEVDYKDAGILQKFMNPWGKIKPATDTGLCARHQRRLAEAVKRARFLAIIPYSSR